MTPRLIIPLVLLIAATPPGAWLPGWAVAALAFAAAVVGIIVGRLSAARPAGALDNFNDEQKTLESALQTTWRAAERERATRAPQSGALLDATLSGMREGVLVVDSEQRVFTWNDATRALFDNAPEAGRPLVALTRNPAIHSAYAAALTRGEDSQERVELLGQESRVVELRVSPLSAEGSHERVGAIGVFFDITRIERLERVRQEFLTNVSHELRTPLTTILAYAETLESGAIDDAENARRFLSIIQRNAARMRALIEDILELSDIESGVMKVEPRRVRLAPVVRDAMSALASKAEERGVELRNEVGAEVFVRADPGRLEQMLTNLVDNAVKFSREGGAVAVRHEATAARDLVSVHDAGDGITPSHLPRLFERFYRVDRARSRELGGTGLGLAIVKHLARAHGGEATARSTPGEGSVFTIEMPRAEQPGGDELNGSPKAGDGITAQTPD